MRQLISSLALFLVCLHLSAQYKTATIYQSKKDTTRQMQKITSLDMADTQVKSKKTLVNIHTDMRYQTYRGVGAALTEAACYNIMQLSQDKREELIKLLFDKQSGAGFDLVRVSIGSCDFSIRDVSYVWDKDETLSTFSIDSDRIYILPVLKRALAYNKDINILASPWSPPAWMKTNNSLLRGGELKREYYPVMANYVIKYLQAYKREGVNITYITPQNEPNYSAPYESCRYTPEQEKDYAVDYLKPAIEKAGFKNVKMMIYDHDKDALLSRMERMLDTKKARKRIDGISVHWYSGRHFEELQMTHERFPEKEIINAEFSTGPAIGSKNIPWSDWEDLQFKVYEMIGDFNNHVSGTIDWSMVLDLKGGPMHHREGRLGGKATVIVDKANNRYLVQPLYYAQAHFSKFIQPGAVRLGTSSYSEHVRACSFMNPDGNIIIVMLNTATVKKDLSLQIDKQSVKMALPPKSLQTIVIST